MDDKNFSHFTAITIASLMAAFVSKDRITPLVLAGRTFSNRSMPMQAAIIFALTAGFFVFFWKMFPRLYRRVAMQKMSTRIFFVLILTATVLIMSQELLKPGMISGYDIDYHMLRIESISQAIRHGQIPVRVNPLFLNGYGYASALFYPDVFLYFPALLRVFGLHTILSAKIFFIVIFTLCFLSAYWSGKKITSSSTAGLISAVVYCLSQYLLQNVYRRGAVGEMQAFIFLPLVVVGLHSLIFNHFEKYGAMVLGFIGLLYSHLVSALLATILVSAVSLFRVRAILTDKARIRRIVTFILITLTSTIAFWLPLVEQLSTGSFRFSQSTYLARSSAVPLSAIFAVTGNFSGNHVVFGLPTLLLCLSWFLFRKTDTIPKTKRFVDWSLGIGAVLLFIVTDYFPWQWINGRLNIIQFPWRLYNLVSIFFALAIGAMLAVIISPRYQRVGVIALIAFMGIHASWVINVSGSAPRDLPHDFYQKTESTFLINNAEWLPAQADLEAIKASAAIVVDENGEAVSHSRSGNEFLIDLPSDCRYVDVPLLYYVGYSATIADDNGMQTELPVESIAPTHAMRVPCPPENTAGRIRIAYTGTFVQTFSLIANMLFVGIFGIMFWKKPELLI